MRVHLVCNTGDSEYVMKLKTKRVLCVSNKKHIRKWVKINQGIWMHKFSAQIIHFMSAFFRRGKLSTKLYRIGKRWSLKQSHPIGNYDNVQRSQPITGRLSRFSHTLTPSWNSTRSLSSLHQSRKHNNSFSPPERRYERLTKHTGAGG